MIKTYYIGGSPCSGKSTVTEILAKKHDLYYFRVDRKREWIPYILKDCTDKDKAFENWMERDAQFALDVQKQCAKEQYVSLINNGEMSMDEMVRFVEKHFEL